MTSSRIKIARPQARKANGLSSMRSLAKFRLKVGTSNKRQRTRRLEMRTCSSLRRSPPFNHHTIQQPWKRSVPSQLIWFCLTGPRFDRTILRGKELLRNYECALLLRPSTSSLLLRSSLLTADQNLVPICFLCLSTVLTICT
jgi:hypothetical protein